MKEKNDLVVDEELLTINSNEQEENFPSLEEAQKRIVETMKKDNLIDYELNNSILDPKNETFVSIIKDNVNFCVNELKDINDTMEKISNQKSSEMFFKKSENIKLLSQHMTKMANVNQKTLDLLIMLLGASGKISDEYDMILTTIDELSSLNNGETEVLKYLLKVKKMIYEIRDNDVKLKQIIQNNEESKLLIEKANDNLQKEIKESEKARKLIDSKCNRLLKRISQNNLYIGFCLLLIVALTIFVGVKFYVH